MSSILIKIRFEIIANGRFFLITWAPSIVKRKPFFVMIERMEESSFPQKEPSGFYQMGDITYTDLEPTLKNSEELIKPFL